MRVSKDGKSVYVEIAAWLSGNGAIHVTSDELRDFHIAVNSDPARRNGHPTLFRRLARLLRENGAPAPPEPEDAAKD